MADSTSLRVVVVTPERAELDTPATAVVLPMYDGERGIQAGHSAFVGQLGPGELRIANGSEVKRYFIDGGFVQVVGNVVNVLTAKATASNFVTVELATKARASAEELPQTTPVERDNRLKAIERAQGLATVARRNT